MTDSIEGLWKTTGKNCMMERVLKYYWESQPQSSLQDIFKAQISQVSLTVTVVIQN